MAIDSFDELLRALHEHPSWREELRRVVLTDDLLGLPAVVRELAAAQLSTERRLDALTARVEALAAQVGSLAARVHELAARVEELAAAQVRTEQALEGLAARMDVLTKRVDPLVGDLVERRYRDKAHAYFAPIVRRLHVLTGDELDRLLEEAVDQGQLDEREAMEVRWADAVASGRRDDAPAYLVLEASEVVDLHDVVRAVDRAGLLARLGTPALPVVAGERVLIDAHAEARRRGVWVVTDGSVEAPRAAR